MAKSKAKTSKKTTSHVSVLDMNHAEARDYFLEPKCYCSIKLPEYIHFNKILSEVKSILSLKSLRELQGSKPKDYENVNYSLYNNKDGKYSWRPFQLIHPAIYVSLVNEITTIQNWAILLDCFKKFKKNKNIICLSMPLKSSGAQSNEAVQISNWWESVEQASVEMSIEYDYTIHTDIVDCYGAIYTLSIAWAVHTKQYAKEHRSDMTLLGNKIDTYIQDMRFAQTNGISQGSVLMDFISEIVLGYADQEITDRIKNIKDYKILRYRDDYRIFTNSYQDGEKILKSITEVLIDLGLKLGAGKTKISSNVVATSYKSDKIDWICGKQYDPSLQKQLLIIYFHSTKHPNSGSLSVALSKFHKRIINMKSINNSLPMIGILIDIAYHNPRSYPIVSAILSKLLSTLEDQKSKISIFDKIQRKFDKLPNTGHLQLWLQRISYPIDRKINYSEPICKLVQGDKVTLWNNDWISNKMLKKALDPINLIDNNLLDKMSQIVPVKEMATFIDTNGYS